MDRGFPADGVVVQTRGDEVWAVAELDFEALEGSRGEAQVGNDLDWGLQASPGLRRAVVEELG
jgi:hypothetical protein